MATIYISNNAPDAVVGVAYSASVERDFGSANQRPTPSLSQGTLEGTGLIAIVHYSDTTTQRIFKVEITGTPSVTGTFYCKVSFKIGTQPYEWRVQIKVEEGVPPQITTPEVTDCETGAEYSMTLEATGTAYITWSIIDGELPNGLSLDSETGIISGIPIFD